MSVSPRSMLFVSAEKPERFAKAITSGADMVCIDLEDAVHPDNKTSARDAVLAFLETRDPQADSVLLGLRINAIETTEGLSDLHSLMLAQPALDVVVLPKVNSATEIRLARRWLQGCCQQMVALIESPAGIEQAAGIAAAGQLSGSGPELLALMLGGADLAAELGAAFSWDSLLSARGRLVNAAKAAGIQAWDVPFLGLNEPDALEHETRAVRAMGFDCKSAIHPAQLAAIHTAFQPSEAELQWAQGVVKAGEQHGHGADGDGAAGAFLYQGKMVDLPVLMHARRLLAQAH
ncbi:MAG: HpcH/HpaI aldolase/citrate lyase family protein [Burkholderiaceae bacterium]